MYTYISTIGNQPGPVRNDGCIFLRSFGSRVSLVVTKDALEGKDIFFFTI